MKAVFLAKILVFLMLFSSVSAAHAVPYTRYEAEAAVMVGGQISNISAASAGAAVTYLDQVGDYLEYVHVAGGDWLILGHANGYLGSGAATQCSVYVNGQDVATAVFASTSNWQIFACRSLTTGPIPADATVRLQIDADDYSANGGRICATQDFLVVCTRLADSEDWLDHLKFGDPQSEAAHNLIASSARLSIGGLNVPCRTLAAAGSVTFTLACQPAGTMFLTVKFWGSDTGAYKDPMYLYNGAIQIGNYETDLPEIDLLMSEPAFAGRFYYSTYIIPASMTSGITSVVLKLAGAPRGIYHAYIHTDPFFLPGHDEPQGTPPDSDAVRTSAQSQYDFLVQQANAAVANMLSWQKYGPAWNQRVAQGTAPAVMTGSIPSNGADGQTNWTTQQWKDNLYGYLRGTQRALAAYAQAWHSSWSPWHHHPEIIERVIAGLDFLCVMQGANGSFWNAADDTWIGGPNRRDGSNCLEGFSLRGIGRAYSLLKDHIPPDRLDNEFLDHDDNPATAALSRRQAWAQMFKMARQHLTNLFDEQGYLVDMRGHAPNQDLADITAAWLLNEGLQTLNPAEVWTEQMQQYAYQAVGLLPEPVMRAQPPGYWLSGKGISCEGNGTSAGGYCGNYGEYGIYFAARLADLTGDPAVVQRVHDTVNAFQYFQYPDIDSQNYLTIRKEGVITWRDNFYPDRIAYGLGGDDSSWGSLYAAVVLGNPAALRQCQLFLQHGKAYDIQFLHYLDDTTNLIENIDLFAQLIALPATEYRLPFEADQLDFAWADEQAANVVIRHQCRRLAFTLNWRHGGYWLGGSPQGQYTPYAAYIPTVNNIARVHCTTDTLDRIANIPMTSLDGFQGFYRCRYGDYLIGMNASDSAYSLTVPQGTPQYVRDLLADETIDTTVQITVPPHTTRVLYLVQYDPADINEDSRVDLADFQALAADWSRCTDPGNPACPGYDPCALLPVGLWTFDQADLTAALGPDLQYGSTWCQANTSFGFADVNGDSLAVINVPQRFGAQEFPTYPVAHHMSPNGQGNTTVNEYTVVMDVKPSLNIWSGHWFLLDVGQGAFDIKIGDVNSQLRTRGGAWYELGPSGLAAGNWCRLAFVIDVGQSISLYVDGTLIGSYDDSAENPAADNGWFATAAQIDFLNNWIGGQVAAIALYDRALPPDVVQQLATVSAGGFAAALNCGEGSAANFLSADVNQDCYVNLHDLAALAARWLHAAVN